VAKFLGFIGIAASTFAQSLEWETVHPYPGLLALRSVAFGEGVFVAASPVGIEAGGTGGRLSYSRDAGRTWEDGINVPGGNFTEVTYVNGHFLAVGIGDIVAISQDGISWDAAILPAPALLLAITFGNGLYVLTGGNGYIATSSDARNWTVRNEGVGQPAFGRAAYGNGRFVAMSVGYGADSVPVATSTNGTHWSFANISLPTVEPGCIPEFGRPCRQFDRITGLASADNQFLILALYGLTAGTTATKILTSPDGTNWTVNTQSSPGTGHFTAFDGAGNNLYVVNGRNFHVSIPHVATNLNEWSAIPLPYSPPELLGTGPSFQSVAYGDGFYVMVGGYRGWARIARSSNLTAWERIDSPQPLGFANLQSIAARGETIVAVTTSASEPLMVSTNGGRTFANVAPPGDIGALKEAHAAQDKFVVVGARGTIIRSSDGLNWTKRLSNTSSDLNEITFADGLWVAVGQGGAIVTSPDASFFTLSAPNTEVNLRGITYGNGLYVVVGDSGAILRSTDGLLWTIFGTEEARNLNSVTFDNGTFVAVGASGIVHYSENGTDWSLAGITASDISEVASADGHFVAIATLQNPPSLSTRVFVSTNAVNWTQQDFLRPVYGIESSDGTLWVTGEAGYIAKAVKNEGGVLQLRGQRTASGEFRLNFTPPAPGNYQVLDSTMLGGAWQAVTNFNNVSAPVDWTDPREIDFTR
jgi:photosystem II stability/assembly factor-like uncharacterized protein